MGLTRYHSKRDFTRTPEPRGRERKRRGPLAFVVQKHAATRLHYDFRLELDGVLLSWAVPKGPSFDPRERRLAMQTEDHPLEYGGFEGVIPKGQYGGGTVMLWDRGTWEPEGDPRAMLRKGDLKFRLHGEKLRGSWVLVRMKPKPGEDEQRASWLLIKHRDEHARPAAEHDVTAELPDSVDSGRDLAAIAEQEGSVWHSDRARAADTPASRRKARLAELARSAKGSPAAEDGGRKPPATKASRKGTVKRSAKKTAKRSGSAGAPKTKTKSKASKATEGAGRERATGGAAARARKAGTGRGRRSKAPGELARRAARLPGARPGALHRRLQMQLATLVDAAPEGAGWVHELKLDGYRAACRLEDGEVRWITRGGKDWTERFEALSPAAAALPARSALLDGEICVVRGDGTTSFQDLQKALSEGRGGLLAYFAFDLLHLDGVDLAGAPLEERKALLAELLAGVPAGGSLRLSGHLDAPGGVVYAEACAHGLEGIVSKRRGAPYRGGRGRDWLKVKCAREQEFVLVGFSAPKGSRKGLGALLLGVHDDGGALRYAGRVGTGFDAATLLDLRARLGRLARATPPVTDPPRGADARGVQWVEPELVGQVAFTEWTADGRVRHPSFQGLREDKPARRVVRERPQPVDAGARAMARTTAKAARTAKARSGEASRERAHGRTAKSAGDARVAGVALTNPERVLYPEQGVTKLELARYYESVADRILPHLENRPLSVVRCPSGRLKECFFQKHSHDTFPSEVKSVVVQEKSGSAPYIMVDSLPGLIALVQMGVLELHPWGSRGDRVDRPDRLFFDLDPDPGVGWERVVEAARRLRERLADLGLESFLKTTGGKGLHVVVPLERRTGWDELKAFSKAVAMELVRAQPGRYVATASKAKRKGRIFIDWLRNGRGATAVAPYSTRAKPGAPVSTPVAWEELTPKLRPDAWNVRNLRARLARLEADPWEGFLGTRQSITAAMRAAVGMG